MGGQDHGRTRSWEDKIMGGQDHGRTRSWDDITMMMSRMMMSILMRMNETP
jgi:hypothetical protein